MTYPATATGPNDRVPYECTADIDDEHTTGMGTLTFGSEEDADALLSTFSVPGAAGVKGRLDVEDGSLPRYFHPTGHNPNRLDRCQLAVRISSR
ncbi:hypothetical protein [Streptomyces yangpuensis]|uniref:hypothetical protein n=1 Tax=Streptomyces yangpuensis TaxID=1648182 RepID=UPI00364C69F2